MIFGREPAFWIGLAVTIVSGIVATLLGEGVISDALAGRITDAVEALAQLGVVFAPLIAGLLIRQKVTPVAAPVLPNNTPVTTPSGDQAVVKPA